MAKIFRQNDCNQCRKRIEVFKVLRDEDFKLIEASRYEVLYLSGVLPTRKANALTSADFEKLHQNTLLVIREAVEKNGSMDEVDFAGNPGSYERKIGRRNKGLLCVRCGGTIEVKNLLGSNSYFCRGCQS